MKPEFAFTLEYVRDVAASKAFYSGVLGLDVKRDHPVFVEFDRFAIASDASLGGDNAPELYWVVDDADAAHAELARKTEITMPLTDQPFGRVFAVRDPDGHSCFVLEWSKSRPSKPTA